MHLPFPRVTVAVVLGTAVGFAVAEQPTALADAGKLVQEEFEVARDGDALLLPVTLQGKQYLFVVDTGSSFTAYDRSLLPKEPKEINNVGSADGDIIKVGFFDPPDASLGRLKLRSTSLVGDLNMSGIRKTSGYEVYGLLGMDFLRNHIVQIDFDAGKLTLLAKVGAEPGLPVPITSAREFPWETEALRVTVEIPGIGQRRFRLDTGCCNCHCGVLSKDLFGYLVGRKKLTVLEGFHKSETIAGTVKERMGRVEGLALGNVKINNMVFLEGEHNALGLGLLSRFNIILDFPHEVMFLKKRERFDEPDQRDETGKEPSSKPADK